VRVTLRLGWPANTEWTVEKLRERFAGHKFKVGSDDDGYAAGPHPSSPTFSWVHLKVHPYV